MFLDRILTDRLRLDRHAAGRRARRTRARRRRRSETIADECTHLNWAPHETPKESAHPNWAPHETPKESADVLQSFRDGWTGRENAVYAVYPRAGEDGAGKYAGNTGLRVDWEHRTGTLGIWLREPFWGRGYSGERARALAAFAFERLDLDVLAVTAIPENERSIRAITKYVDAMGGREEGTIRNGLADADGEVHDVRWFSVTREEYVAAADGEREIEFGDAVEFAADTRTDG